MITETETLSVGDVIEITAERIAYGGEAVGHHRGLVVFVPLGAPGDRLRVRITERKKSYARGVVEEVLAGSPDRREPACEYFGSCGGCQLQHIEYQSQLAAKSSFISESLRRVAGIAWSQPIEVRSAAEYGYRARAELKAERSDRGEVRIGFNRARSRSVCDITHCPVLAPQLDRELASIRESIRESLADGKDRWASYEIAAGESGIGTHPEIQSVATRPLTRQIAGARYAFSPSTFFQANAFLVDDLVREATAGESGALAIDLYCGVGLFTVALARQFDRVIGIEANLESVRFARENLLSNEIRAGAEIVGDRVDRWLARPFESGAAPPDLVLLDPPRVGAAEEAGLIPRLRAPRIVYVSCDPATFARDIGTLSKTGYRLVSVVGFDIFPQTYHVEIVAKLDYEER